MKMTTVLYLLLFVTGCAPTLKEVREYQPVKTVTVHKEPFCMYNKLYKTALEMPVSFWCLPELYDWKSTWDPSLKEGEIFWGISKSSQYPVILFHISEASIEVKTRSGGAFCTAENLNYQRASAILASADFSGCPDIE